MSHAAQINYEQIALQCQSICEVAENQVTELNKMLDELETTSSRLLNEQTSALRRQIEEERLKLSNGIEDVKRKAENKALASSAEATELQRQVDIFASQKLVEMRALLDSLLSDRLLSHYQNLLDKSKGVVRTSNIVDAVLRSIDDEILRQFVYLAYLDNPELSKEDLLASGKALMNDTVEARYARETERIRQELGDAKIASKEVDRIIGDGKNLTEIREAASAEIVGEKVRQKSLKIIIRAIEERGFIVDKRNIKINRDTNEVVLVALKASGEKAEFRIFLDGRFIYDFRGYEGQACQKDIGPFMRDLEEIYGVHVIKQQEIWSNPDKIATMKYQSINTNKDKR